MIVADLEAYEVTLLNALEHDLGLHRGLAEEMVIADRGWGNDGSRSGQQQALDRLMMLAIETLWSVP
jgi:hypothetical protein